MSHFDKLSEHDKINAIASILSIKGLITDQEIEAVSEALFKESVKRATENQAILRGYQG
jgi:hypothetical protein